MLARRASEGPSLARRANSNHTPVHRDPHMTRRPIPIALGLCALVALLGTGRADVPAPKVTTPKAFLGFNLGDDYCLANYKQYAGYLARLEAESDRLKVVEI